MQRILFGLVAVLAIGASAMAEEKADEGWIVLFGGKSLDGWKANENTDSFTLQDGAIVAHGERSHLFYVGDDKPFKNFEFKADVMTTPGSNSGIYFHTKWQDSGWPKYGFEAQVNNTYESDPKKTGSLYGVENVTEAPAKDNVWFPYYIKVDGRHIIIQVNGKTTVDYTQPEDRKAGEDFTRVVGQGTFALQAHDPHSKVLFKNIRVRRLP